MNHVKELLYRNGQWSEIINFIKQCKIREKVQRGKSKETIPLKRAPHLPVSIISYDIFSYKDNNYLNIYDSYSGYIGLAEEDLKCPKLFYDNVNTVNQIKFGLIIEIHPKITSNELLDHWFQLQHLIWNTDANLRNPTYAKSGDRVQVFLCQ